MNIRKSFCLFLGLAAVCSSLQASSSSKKKGTLVSQASPAAQWLVSGPEAVVGENGGLAEYRTMFQFFGACYGDDSGHEEGGIYCTVTASFTDQTVVRQSLNELAKRFADYVIVSMQDLGLRTTNVTESEQHVADRLQEIHKLTESLHAKKEKHAADEDIKHLEEQIASQALSLEEMKDSMANAMLYELREFVEQELPATLVSPKVFEVINDSLEDSARSAVSEFVDNYVVIEEKVENNGLSEPGDIIIEEEEEVGE